MTSKIIVTAAHRPVQVTVKPLGEDQVHLNVTPSIVPAGESWEFFVWEGCDLLIHEVKPAEAVPGEVTAAVNAD